MKLLTTSLLLATSLTTSLAGAQSWSQIEQQAKGQKVYFNAWGGSPAINEYIEWAAEEVLERYQVEVQHVKITDAGEVVNRVLTEKQADKQSDGSVDLIWINGENFANMKRNGLLFGPFASQLPNAQLLPVNAANLQYDFTVATEGYESPWGGAQLVFFYDSEWVSNPPTSADALLAWSQQNRGRFTYPAPPQFHGSSFLKQVLSELNPNDSRLLQPVTEQAFAELSQPLWNYLDALHPNLWRSGRSFAVDAGHMMQLLNDGEINISFSFNPNDASNAIINGQLPDSVRTYVHDAGSLGNTHFVAIPFNSSATEGAMVFANFLLSAEAQARKANIEVWGDPTVLDWNRLSQQQQALFSALPSGPASLTPKQLGRILPEPHPSWMEALEIAWRQRYAQ